MDHKRSLSEISHLFLSEVRERQVGNGTRPVRVPPPKKNDVSIDMSPEEFGAAFGDELQLPHSDVDSTPGSAPMPAHQASVVLASHLADQASGCIRHYARHLAVEAGRVGLIELDSGELNLTCFEFNGGEAAIPTVLNEIDGRRIGETLAELCFDVKRWLVYLHNPRTAEARELIRHSPHWVLLTLSGDEGIVASYRSLKGLAEVGKPRLSLAVLDARDDAQADAVFRKMDAAGRQFLACPIDSESPVRPAQNVTEHPVLQCRAADQAKNPNVAPHWQIVSEFLAGASVPQCQHPRPQAVSGASMKTSASIHAAAPAAAPQVSMHERIAPATMMMQDTLSEVIDLDGDGMEGSILDAVIRQGGAAGQWVQAPIHPPMCPQAVLTVGRDHRLILLAVAGRGLSELRSIGLALRWMSENRELIRMALPQLSIDIAAQPAVRLLVDHADLSADVLQPLLQSSTVTVHAYRKLKWGPKTGLLLEAA